MKRTAVLDVVGLTEGLLGPALPRITAYAQRGRLSRITPAFPAVTCTAQADYLTGLPPSRHGIVGNGWYHRELAEVQFWKQSNRLVAGEKLWEGMRTKQQGFTCAKLFWWYNMYSSADYSVTPRPMYPADGRKFFDIYTSPNSLGAALKADLGEFPFPTFWGPAAGVDSPAGKPDAVSRWIAAAARWVEEHHHPTLSLVYLPHLDYNLQRLGPAHPEVVHDLARIDTIVGDLLDFYHRQSVEVALISEYGLVAVDQPVHLNRLFRDKGWLVTREELGLELLDPGASRVFAAADHQVAHIYINDPSLTRKVREALEGEPGVAHVMDRVEKQAAGIDHPRAGDLIAVANERAWFTYYYWMDERRAPDFARTVDIHRKPGYDPVELFLDPKLPLPKARILWRLLQKKLGFRMLMDVIPLDASLVKGSHGARPADPRDHPILLLPGRQTHLPTTLRSTEVRCELERWMLT